MIDRTFTPSIVRHARALCLGLVAIAALAAAPTYRLRVDGLACPFCAYGIEKKLKALDGVVRLETNIKDGTVLVIMKAAGFTLNGFEQVESVDAPRGGVSAQ